MDKLMGMMEKHSQERYGFEISMRYSTADEYLATINIKENTYPTYDGDFFPYTTVERCPENICISGQRSDHWTGYYSTKPVLKQLIRDTYKNYRSLSKFISFIKMVEV
jgi:hypothetical protein